MSRMIILRGLPGSGKTTLARQLAEQQRLGRGRDSVVVVSNDTKRRNAAGEYAYNAVTVHAAQKACYAAAMIAATAHTPLIVVDNTNTLRAEYMPYVMLAQFFDYRVEMVQLAVPLRYAIDNCKNGAPRAKIHRMAERFEKRFDTDPPEHILTPAHTTRLAVGTDSLLYL